MIITTNLNQARKQIEQLKKAGKEIIVQAQDPEFNRAILEIPEVDVLVSPELHNRKDKLKERDSGLNEVLCKIAKKNNIKIGIDLEKIKSLPKKEKAQAISRLQQNILLCKKTGCELTIFPQKKYAKQKIMEFLISLGSSTQIAKKAAE
ncbi:MAG: hypothetical protein RL557_41 [archaeon]|jgi:RNase P/RNase MRP subunit p30